MRCFSNIAKLIKEARGETTITQSEIATRLGLRNGQFVSNVERGLCGFPLPKLKMLQHSLNLKSEDIKEAILKDKEVELDHCLGIVDMPKQILNTEPSCDALQA